jgi:hypothetical protein
MQSCTFLRWTGSFLGRPAKVLREQIRCAGTLASMIYCGASDYAPGSLIAFFASR